MKYGKLELGQVEAIVNKLGGMDGVERFLRDELILTERQSAMIVEPVVDTIIRVDRSIRPVYPNSVKEVLYPELENTGPVEFDFGQAEQWLHPKQVRRVVKGNKIHEHLKDNNLLVDCYGLRDLEEIQKKGIASFWKHFQGKAVFAWKSIVRHDYGRLKVPCLCEDGDMVVLDWDWLAYDWYSDYPALRFAR